MNDPKHSEPKPLAPPQAGGFLLPMLVTTAFPTLRIEQRLPDATAQDLASKHGVIYAVIREGIFPSKSGNHCYYVLPLHLWQSGWYDRNAKDPSPIAEVLTVKTPPILPASHQLFDTILASVRIYFAPEGAIDWHGLSELEVAQWSSSTRYCNSVSDAMRILGAGHGSVVRFRYYGQTFWWAIGPDGKEFWRIPMF